MHDPEHFRRLFGDSAGPGAFLISRHPWILRASILIVERLFIPVVVLEERVARLGALVKNFVRPPIEMSDRESLTLPQGPLYEEDAARRRELLSQRRDRLAQVLDYSAYYGHILANDMEWCETHVRLSLEAMEGRTWVGTGEEPRVYLLWELAFVLGAQNKYQLACDALERAMRLHLEKMEEVFFTAPEDIVWGYRTDVHETVGMYASLFLFFGQAITIDEKLYAMILLYKGVWSEIYTRQNEILAERRYPVLLDMRRKIQTEKKREIAEMLIKPAAVERTVSDEMRLIRAKERRKLYDVLFGTCLADKSVMGEICNFDWKAASRRLSSESILLEFLRFTPTGFRALPEWDDSIVRRLPDRYLAVAVRDGRALVFDIGEAAEIDELVREHKESMLGTRKEGGERWGLDEPDLPEREASARGNWRETGRKLFVQLIEPMKELLSGAEHIIIAPDNELCVLGFGTLCIDEEMILADAYKISYITSCRDLEWMNRGESRTAGHSLVIADPEFDIRRDEIRHSRWRPRSHLAGKREKEGARRFRSLSGTKQEGQIVANILGVEAAMRDRATMALVRGCRGPAILHIATHGFFLDDQKALSRTPLGSSGVSDRADKHNSWHPLLRSGLALAGANTLLANGDRSHQGEFGLLTAVDVSEMDLFGTNLVVLSACETALGEVRSGEGVYGLRRAFVVAGARTLVMSLWKVPDVATRELMQQFYGYLASGEGRAAALQKAQLDVRKKYPHPYYWAAFICQGDYGPLPERLFAIKDPAGIQNRADSLQ